MIVPHLATNCNIYPNCCFNNINNTLIIAIISAIICRTRAVINSCESSIPIFSFHLSCLLTTCSAAMFLQIITTYSNALIIETQVVLVTGSGTHEASNIEAVGDYFIFS